ncbi:MAG TPA: hypothetical protein DD435_01355 [Cyanobacteria bacterium UBA8530]|nr:hypothetical protein [Cyanobacteria bacterium UBA8530]
MGKEVRPSVAVGHFIDVLLSVGERIVPCEAEILEIEDSLIIATSPRRKGILVPIDVEEVAICIKMKSGIYFTTLPCLVEKIPENRIALTLPDEETLIFLQRRKYVRVETRLSCTVELKNADSFGAPINGEIYNISGGGCAMSLPSSVPVDRSVKIGFILNEEGQFTFMGRTLRSTIVPGPQGVSHRIGVEFDSPSEADRAKLVRYVFNVQRLLLWKNKGNA